MKRSSTHTAIVVMMLGLVLFFVGQPVSANQPIDTNSRPIFQAMNTDIEINGTIKGTIKGADFARALFSIWLGEKPFNRGFKKALLGEN